ncbi:MAG TPA: hypothetical protein VK607_02985, partial [Kofleriaceae bacterium]|nr:hypothetical protein [Kofleriaceae bacterium]
MIEDVAIHPTRVLGEVGAERRHQVALEVATPVRGLARDVGGDHGRHATDHGVAMEPLESADVRVVGQRLPGLPSREHRAQLGLAVRAEVLVEPHRVEVEQADAADRHAERVLRQRELEERTCGDHGELWQLLGEPAELPEDRSCRLDLVEEQQG